MLLSYSVPDSVGFGQWTPQFAAAHENFVEMYFGDGPYNPDLLSSDGKILYSKARTPSEKAEVAYMLALLNYNGFMASEVQSKALLQNASAWIVRATFYTSSLPAAQQVRFYLLRAKIASHFGRNKEVKDCLVMAEGAAMLSSYISRDEAEDLKALIRETYLTTDVAA